VPRNASSVVLSLFCSLEGPLQSIVSMGSRHPVPHRGEDQRGRYPPLDLIQWVYQMERDGKVRAADISVPARHKVQYLYTERKHTSHTHHTHTHTLIYYSNKSLVPPNFLWISISPWTYLH